MKKIIGATIIILFLIPFLSYSARFFKGNFDQRRAASEKKQAIEDALKVPATTKLFKKPKEAAVPKVIIKSASESSNEKPADLVNENTKDINSKEQKGESNIHDDILGYRLNSNNRIKQIQAALKKAGFYKGEINGKVGPQVKRSIREFQKAKKLNPDGVVGPKTWDALEKYLKN